MENKIIFAFLIVLLFGCKPKNNDPVPQQNQPPYTYLDSVSIAINKPADTIYTYSNNKKGAFIITITGFDNFKKPVSNQTLNKRLTVELKAIDKQGTFLYNGNAFTMDTMQTNTPLNFEYAPVNSKGKQRIEVTVNTPYKTFKDTLFFEIKTYQPIPYTVGFNSLNFTQSPTSTFNLNMTINTTSNSMQYSYVLPSGLISPINSPGAVGINDLNHNTFVSINNPLTFTTGTVEQLQFNLTNATIGSYRLPIKIFDGNGDFKIDTLRFTVQ